MINSLTWDSRAMKGIKFIYLIKYKEVVPVPKPQIMKSYRESRKCSTFLTSALDGVELSSSHSDHFIPGQ
jgi:hypothetical protein